jgi:hypothetical protein
MLEVETVVMAVVIMEVELLQQLLPLLVLACT